MENTNTQNNSSNSTGFRKTGFRSGYGQNRRSFGNRNFRRSSSSGNYNNRSTDNQSRNGNSNVKTDDVLGFERNRFASTDREINGFQKRPNERRSEGGFRKSYSGGFQRRRSFGGSNFRRNRFAGAKINPLKYVAKATESEPQTIYESSYKFDELDLHESLKENILRRYSHPTKIQDQVIPHIIGGKDVLGLASTGSGKTAAFLIPLIDKILKERQQKCLIIVPTRDLAEQIRDEFYEFTKDTNLRSSLVIGGASMGKQIRELRARPDFIFGTPGRLKDLNNKRFLDLRFFNNIVLDEVDRMLDMGFVEDIKFLISKMSEQRQSMFFSATMSKEAETIANTLLAEPIKVQIERQAPGKSVDQDIVRYGDDNLKIEKLHDILNKEEVSKTLIKKINANARDPLIIFIQLLPPTFFLGCNYN